MNSLSWLLYFGNVAGNLGTLFILFGIVLFIVGFISWLRYFFERDEWCRKMGKEKYPTPFLSLWITLLCFIFFLVGALSPSQNTVYAIAASELGERAMKTPVAGKFEKALEVWLDKQIKNTDDDDKRSHNSED